MDRRRVRFTVNGREAGVWASPNQTLLEVLRDEVGAVEVKYGCGEGVCGTCTVLFDGAPVNACLLLAVQADGHELVTVRGLPDDGEGVPPSAPSSAVLHPLQKAFLEKGASQCGFCTPGMVLTAYSFVAENPKPTRDDVRRALAGNLCRCTGYKKIVDAVEAYAAEMSSKAPGSTGRQP